MLLDAMYVCMYAKCSVTHYSVCGCISVCIYIYVCTCVFACVCVCEYLCLGSFEHRVRLAKRKSVFNTRKKKFF